MLAFRPSLDTTQERNETIQNRQGARPNPGAFFVAMSTLLMAACGGPPEPSSPTSSPIVSTTSDAPASSVKPPAPPKKTADGPAEAPSKPSNSSFKITNGALETPGPVLFATGAASVRPESDSVLDFVRDYLVAKPDVTVLRIEAHSDNQGSSAANQALTMARSLAVAKALVSRGIDCARLAPVGFGDTKPIADNQTPEGRAANRRMVFAPAALRGKAIGGMPVDGGGLVAGDPCK